MTTSSAADGASTPTGACEICSKLSDVETSFYKYGWDDMDRPLPAEASRLEPVGPIDSYERERNHLRRCPVCGTYYHYTWSYEYLVNGSEDEEVLTRLTPEQAGRLLGDQETRPAVNRPG